MPPAPPYDVAAYLAQHVPITRAMGVRLAAYGPEGIALAAPLAPNVNDKGIAFGGSMASLLALAGWALTDCVLREAGEEGADVVVASMRLAFLRPVAGEIVARCARPPAAEVERFLGAWRSARRSRWRLEPFVEAPDGKAVAAQGVYVARPRPAAAP